MTTEEIIGKIIEYKKDPVLFCKEQCKIRHPTKGFINFDVFPAQEKCIEDFLKHRFNIILKSRQLGISTVVAGYITWRLVFFPYQEIRVVATKNSTAQIIIEMAFNMFDSISKEILDVLNVKRTTEQKHTVMLSNGSRVQAFTKGSGDNPDTGVGSALSLLVIDEAALIKNIDEIWTSVYPTISQGGDCIILSTPRGIDNWFYKMFERAEIGAYAEGEEKFNPIKLMWWENLERVRPPETPLEKDENIIGGFTNSWAKATFANLSKKRIAQEYCVAGDSIVTIFSNGKFISLPIEDLYNKMI